MRMHYTDVVRRFKAGNIVGSQQFQTVFDSSSAQRVGGSNVSAGSNLRRRTVCPPVDNWGGFAINSSTSHSGVTQIAIHRQSIATCQMGKAKSVKADMLIVREG